MAFDIKKFLDEIGLDDESKTAALGLFEKKPDVVGKIETLLSSQVEARITPLKAELESKQRDLDAQFDTLASIRGGDSDAVAKAEAEIEKLSAQSAVLTARLKRIATENGLDADAILKDVVAEVKPVVKPTETTALDADKILGQANRSALAAFENAALMEDLAAEHQQLFGKPMSRVDLIAALKDTIKKTGNPNLGLRDVFEQKFNVAAKREELREADVQRRITEAVKARETALADEFALRGAQGQPPAEFKRTSPIFSALQKDDKPAHIAGVPEAVVASIADYKKRVSARNVA